MQLSCCDLVGVATSIRLRYRQRCRRLGVFAFASLPFAAVLLVTPSSPGAAQCVGDCNGDHAVTIEELLTLVNIALDTAQPSACSLGLPPGAEVTIALIIEAVNSALNKCPNPQFRAVTGVS